MGASRAEIVGRTDELEAVDRLLDRAAEDVAALVIAGEAGIGKTTIWDAARAGAEHRGFRVLRSRPARTEAQLTLGGFGDLFGGLSPALLAALPEPQRHALEVALLRSEPGKEVADQRALSVATVALLRELADERPVLIAVDDVQWLDESSSAILAFAARRLEGARVGMLVAVRGTGAALDPLGLSTALAPRLERQTLGPLSLAALHRLFLARLGRSFPRLVLSRIEQASGGNAFYALEVARALERHGADVTPAEPLPVPETLAALTAERIARLPANTQEALLLAAAAYEPTAETLGRAGVQDPAATLRPALEDAIAELAGGAIRFAHPLLAQAALASIDPARLDEIHARLAAASRSAEAHARHLGEAADGPDEAAATALERTAERAQARGASLDAIALFERASVLTPDPDRGTLRAIRAAESAYADLADPTYAESIVVRALERAAPGPARAEAMSLRAILVYYHGRQTKATLLAEEGVAEAGDDRIVLASNLLRASYIHAQTDTERALEEALEAATILEDERRPVDTDLLAHAFLARGLAWHQLIPGREADIVRGTALHSASGRSWDWERCEGILYEQALHTDDLDRARARMTAQIERLAARGAEDPFRFVHMSLIHARLGEWAVARAWGERAVEVFAHEGDRWPAFALRGLAWVNALEGRTDEARELSTRGLEHALETGDIVVANLHHGILGLIALSTGDAVEADRQMRAAADLEARLRVKHPFRTRIAGDAVEAALGVGDLRRAQRTVEHLEHACRLVPTPWTLCMAARTRGLLEAARGNLDAAAAALERALVEHERLPMPFERARTLLAKGRVHHRRKEKKLADETLREALETFEQLGSPLWAEQARTELERVRLRRREPGELNETERRVAELAAQGLSNQEIAQRAFVSVKTVEANLTRVYRKLGIRSRAALARALM